MSTDEQPPVYQWRYHAGHRGHISQWKDVDESSGIVVTYGSNRITKVEFRIRPAREVCEATLRVHGASGSYEGRCVKTLGHPASERHITTVGELTVEWE